MRSGTTKIFGIGLSKTGTTSLARALDILGYRTRDYMGVTKYIPGDLSSIDLREIDTNDAFTDTPIPSFYKELDAKYPNSKFILTTRSVDDWLRSCKKQFTQRMVEKQNEATNRLHTDLYGCFAFDYEQYKSGYHRFVDGVLEYFKDRPQDLLILDICGGAQWEPLCSFLNQPMPDAPFPLTNVSAIQWMDIQKIVAIAKQAGKEIKRIYDNDSLARSSERKNRLLLRIREPITRMVAGLASTRPSSSAVRLAKATNISRRIILRGLREINPSIPVISPANSNIPLSERRSWHHVWVIDPLNGGEHFSNHSGTFTVNIALVQGGRAIWGIIYNPLSDCVYYAKGANGSYKMNGKQTPRRLSSASAIRRDSDVIVVSGNGNLSDEAKHQIDTKYTDFELVFADASAGLCMVAEGKAAMQISLEPTMEWDTAAGHAIVRASGKRVHILNSREELSYNKENFVNTSFIAE